MKQDAKGFICQIVVLTGAAFLGLFIGSCLRSSVIVTSGEFKELSALRAENRQLRADLEWWECTAHREPEQPPAPIAVDGPTLLEDIPQLELDEAVPPAGVVGAARSGKWPSVRAEYLRLHPTCEACGTDKELNVHHVHPFHEHPELELDMKNLITLCREHHLTLGHDPDGPDGPLPRNWSASNPHVRRNAAKMLSKTVVAP